MIHSTYWRKLTIPVLLTAVFFGLLAGQETFAADGWKAFEEARTDAYAKELETYLREYLVDKYPLRAAEAWDRDYSSVGAFLRSVEPNRERWNHVVKPPAFLRKAGALKRRPASLLNAGLNAQWLTLPLNGIAAEGVLVLPKGASAEHPVPLVIVVHGIGSYPERPLGLDTGGYHAYAKELVDAGFAVLAPMNLRSKERRGHIERLCRLADITLPGIELVRLQYLLDEVLADTRIDGDRVGMWGLSLGGMATMFWMPLEPRIKAGIVTAWFNHRLTKMAVPDKRYSAFIATDEEHAFFNGWLTEFADHDVASLICPRPLMIQHGKKDRIAHWPQVIEEFDTAKEHYQKLSLADRIELVVHDGGHEAIVKDGISFLTKWLKPDRENE